MNTALLPTTGTATHYQPTFNGLQNDWEFTTPMGCSRGFWTEAEAKIAALRTEAQDRDTAMSGVGPLAGALHEYFYPEVLES